MQAIIIAAGLGTRLRPLTEECPKCLLSISEDKLLLDIQLDNLIAVGITDITIVTGYNSESIVEYCKNKNIKLIYNPNYANCNQLGSFLCSYDSIHDDCVVIFSDVLFHKNVLTDLMESQSELVVAIEIRDEFNNQDDKVSLVDNKITKIGKNRVTNNEAKAEFIGLSKLKYEQMKSFYKIAITTDKDDAQAYFYDAIQSIIDRGNVCDYIEVISPWIEIDYKEDLNLAKSDIFSKILDYGNGK